MMNTQRILRTRGAPLATVRRFLQDLTAHAGLHGIVAPLRAPAAAGVCAAYVTDPAELQWADPFAPVMQSSAAALAAEAARMHPQHQIGAVLRPCEACLLVELAKRESFLSDRVLLVGVDCLGAFPTDDYAWRASKPGGTDRLTREAFQFTRQAGIAPARYRPACQMCTSPIPQAAALRIGLLGIPARDFVLVSARDGETAEKIQLDRFTHGVAEPMWLARHERMRATVVERRRHARQRLISGLPVGLPKDVDGLQALLRDCAPCRACVQACALYASVTTQPANRHPPSASELRRWLAACVGCGLCEAACPKQLPLAAVFERIGRGSTASPGYLPGQSLANPLVGAQ